MSQIVLIVAYVALFLFIIRKALFFRLNGISPNFLSFAFLVKVLAGFAYGAIYIYHYQRGDTQEFLINTNEIYLRLTTNPYDFLKNYTLPEDFLKNFGNYSLIYCNVLLRFITGGYYYVHAVWFAFIGFLGSIVLFKALSEKLNLDRFILLSILIFMPSTLFWTSGLHKDGMVMLGIGMILYGLFLWKDRVNVRKGITLFCFGLLMVLAFRYFIFLFLIPGISALIMSWNKSNAFSQFLLVYGFFLLLLLAGDLCISEVSIPEILMNKQTEILNSKGNSSYEIPLIENNWFSVIQAIPTALMNGILRPFFWNINSPLEMAGAIEVVFLLLCFCFGLIKNGFRFSRQPVQLFLLFFTINIFMFYGLLIANSGTLIRYRAIVYCFFAILLAEQLNKPLIGVKEKLKHFFSELIKLE